MAILIPQNLEAAYQACENLARTHYENFPVASVFLPSKIRRPIAVIYAFARQADDIADEGDLTPDARLQKLHHYWQSLEALAEGSPPTDPLFIALRDVLQKNPHLPIGLFFDLLTAFKQDVIKSEYATVDEILNYCHYSANPIGRLLLYLTNNATEENLKDSDILCTVLQLINFLQDLRSDLTKRNRCYLPKDEMIKFNITLETLKSTQETKALQDLISLQLNRIQALLNTEGNLGKRLSGFFGFEIRLITAAAQQMIYALQNRKNVYDRPIFKLWYWPKLFLITFFGATTHKKH